MANLEPIVVNEPKVQETYTFNKNDIKSIAIDGVKKAIDDGDIPTGSKIYKHVITKGTNPAYTTVIYNDSPDEIDNVGKINSAFHKCIAAYYLGGIATGGTEKKDYVLITSSYDGSSSQTTLTYIYLNSGNLAVGTYVYSGTITDTVTKL